MEKIKIAQIYFTEDLTEDEISSTVKHLVQVNGVYAAKVIEVDPVDALNRDLNVEV